jgi:hypothetical protein
MTIEERTADLSGMEKILADYHVYFTRLIAALSPEAADMLEEIGNLYSRVKEEPESHNCDIDWSVELVGLADMNLSSAVAECAKNRLNALQNDGDN